MQEYAFVFSGGSCGSFVETIWYYYLYKNKVRLILNPQTGDCHNIWKLAPGHYHYLGDIPKLRSKNNKIKIVLIVFDEDDLDLITNMQYHKFTKGWLKENLQLAKEKWPKIAEALGDPNKEQQTWINHLKEGYQYWIQNIEKDQIDYIIDFKTIINGDLNKLICSYLNTNPSVEVDDFIQNYRLINKKLYGTS